MSSQAANQSWFQSLAPEMAEKWEEFHNSVYDSGELDRLTKELIAAAASTVGRCPHCTKAHIQKAKYQGSQRSKLPKHS